MMQVNREKRKPSNTPNKVRMKARGPGINASQFWKFCPTHLKKNQATMNRPNTDMDIM